MLQLFKPALWTMIALLSTFALAADKEHATVIRDTTLYLQPGTDSEKLIRLERGRDLVVLEQTTLGGTEVWFKVFATVVQGENVRELTGWVPSQPLIAASMANADQIIFGEAVDSENQAEQRGGRKNAAQDAMRLYYRLWEYIPTSPLAGEALWRAADIRWQLDKADVAYRMTSSRNVSSDARRELNEDTLKEVIKKFPGSKWADLAHYDLLDNKLCVDWKGEAKCPEKETEIYEKYAKEHPQSPKATEALFNAAWRQAALVDIYKSNDERDKSEKAKRKALELAQELLALNPQGDWKPRAVELIYVLQQNIPVYGNASSGPEK